MKKFYLLTLLLCCFLTSITAQNAKPFVIPELKEWKGTTGEFTLNTQTRIVYPKNQPELQRIAQMLADDCKEMFDYTPTIAEGKGQKGDIILSLKKDKKLGKEGYTIKIADRINLSAPEAVGIYWGTRTLLQMAEQNLTLPQGEIRDFPDYETVVVQVDLEAVHLIISHDLHVVTQIVHRDELTSTINHESTDFIIREISDFTFRKGEALFCHLQEGACSPIDTYGFRSRKVDAVGNLDGITFLTQLLVLFQ